MMIAILTNHGQIVDNSKINCMDMAISNGNFDLIVNLRIVKMTLYNFNSRCISLNFDESFKLILHVRVMINNFF